GLLQLQVERLQRGLLRLQRVECREYIEVSGGDPQDQVLRRGLVGRLGLGYLTVGCLEVHPVCPGEEILREVQAPLFGTDGTGAVNGKWRRSPRGAHLRLGEQTRRMCPGLACRSGDLWQQERPGFRSGLTGGLVVGVGLLKGGVTGQGVLVDLGEIRGPAGGRKPDGEAGTEEGQREAEPRSPYDAVHDPEMLLIWREAPRTQNPAAELHERADR